MIDYDVIGGKSDGTKVFSTTRIPQVTIELRREQYIAIVFSVKGEKDKRTVTIYMRAGMAPAEAVKLWCERNRKEKTNECKPKIAF